MFVYLMESWRKPICNITLEIGLTFRQLGLRRSNTGLTVRMHLIRVRIAAGMVITSLSKVVA